MDRRSRDKEECSLHEPIVINTNVRVLFFVFCYVRWILNANLFRIMYLFWIFMSAFNAVTVRDAMTITRWCDAIQYVLHLVDPHWIFMHERYGYFNNWFKWKKNSTLAHTLIEQHKRMETHMRYNCDYTNAVCDVSYDNNIPLPEHLLFVCWNCLIFVSYWLRFAKKMGSRPGNKCRLCFSLGFFHINLFTTSQKAIDAIRDIFHCEVDHRLSKYSKLNNSIISSFLFFVAI